MRFELGKLELFGLDLNALLGRWWRGLNALLPVPLSEVFLRPAPRVLVKLDEKQLMLHPVASEASSNGAEGLLFSESEYALLEDVSLQAQLLG